MVPDRRHPWQTPDAPGDRLRADATAEVIAFRPKARLTHSWPQNRSTLQPASPVKTLQQYENGSDEDDYGHRMIVNAAAFVTCVGLVTVGLWLAIKIADFRRDQDCVLAGRLNCAQISVVKHLH
jgi:hypothetical protein